MPGVPIFLCAWHVKRAWLSNLISTVADADKRTEMWRALDGLMRLNVQLPASHSKEDLAKLCADVLERFYGTFSEQAAFITYFKREWAGKIGALYLCYCLFRCFFCSASRVHAIDCPIGSMFAAELWAQLWRNIPHSNQETAAAIESYHNVTKVLTPMHVRFHAFTHGNKHPSAHQSGNVLATG